MTYRQLLGDLIAENGTYWAKQGNKYRAVQYFQLGVHLNPDAAEVFRMLAASHVQLAVQAEQQEATLQWLRGTPNIQMIRRHYQAQAKGYRQASIQALEVAELSGVAPPPKENYWIRQEAKAREWRELARRARRHE